MLRPLLLAALGLSIGCGQNTPEPNPRQGEANQSERIASLAKLDAVFGRWVCIADNGGGFMGAEMDLEPNGVAAFSLNGKTFTRKFKREPGRDWALRRKGRLSLEAESVEWWNEYSRPGVVMVYFEEQGRYIDHGSDLLMYDPHVPVLYNFLTQMWCRPGHETRVTTLRDPIRER